MLRALRLAIVGVCAINVPVFSLPNFPELVAEIELYLLLLAEGQVRHERGAIGHHDRVLFDGNPRWPFAD